MNNGRRDHYRAVGRSAAGSAKVRLAGAAWPEVVAQPIRTTRDPHETWVTVLLTLEHPRPELLNGLDRGERYRRLMAHAWEQRHRLERWVEEQGLCGEVQRIGEPNSFHLLFVHCTFYAAHSFAQAPAVVEMTITQSD